MKLSRDVLKPNMKQILEVAPLNRESMQRCECMHEAKLPSKNVKFLRDFTAPLDKCTKAKNRRETTGQ